MATPPKYPFKFLRWFCREDFLEEIEGDLIELYENRYEKSTVKAKFLLLWDVIRSFRLLNLKRFRGNNVTMNSIGNYIKIYFRRFRKEATHYVVNISGLALGLAVFFFVTYYVHLEKTIDKFHSKSHRIYRVVEHSSTEDGTTFYSSVANPFAISLKEEFPEIEETARMVYFGSSTFRYKEKQVADRSYAIVDSSIFDIWDINILSGDPNKVPQGDVGMVITKSFARRVFGDEDPIGKVVENRFGNSEVLAVMEGLPTSSTYQFNLFFVTDFKWSDEFQKFFNDWDSHFMTTWVLLKDGADPKRVQAQKDEFLKKFCPEELRSQHDFRLQNMENIHLGSSHITPMGMEPQLSIPYSRNQFVVIVLIIGFFVLFIASINYINLSSVQALKRSGEASVRRINGATSGQLRIQLITETFLTLLFAYLVAALFFIASYPKFLQLTDKVAGLQHVLQPGFLAYLLITFITLWLLASVIPALYYSAQHRSFISVKNPFVGRGELLRKSLVVLQYGISMILIIGAMVFYRQLSFIQNKDLGFEKEQHITLDINSGAARSNFKAMVNRLREHSSILNASASSRVPGEWKSIPQVSLKNTRNDVGIEARHYAVDEYWLDTYGIQLKEGRTFSGNDASDSLKILLNEQAVEALDLKDPIGHTLWVQEDTLVRMQVIGVVSNFHFESLHQTISPVIITSWNNTIYPIDYFTVHYSGNTPDVVDHIEAVQKEFDPSNPAEINFLDQQWNRFYRADQSRAYLILVATILSIIISSFGLFGLVNFTVERKTKEIGIRKILGASIPGIIKLILKDYFLLLLIAILISAPLAWWFLSGWLSGFAYRIHFSPVVFGIAFLIALMISFATVITRVLRLAQSNPVNSLRNE